MRRITRAEEWNRRFPPGTAVLYGASQTVTLAEAEELVTGAGVVLVAASSAPVALWELQPHGIEEENGPG
jgi:hypothetical protein